MPIPTPHINAKKEDIANTVLMPGDPLRAKFIAENFLTEPKLVNNVRGVQGHTGTWKGVPVTVMASGMGMPSIGIYSWELFNFYDVKNIIRIGSAGALQDDLKLRDVIAGQAACTDSNYLKSFGFGNSASFAPIADYTLLSTAVNTAKEHGVSIRVGNIVSSDCFYSAEGQSMAGLWKRMGALAIEMEGAALYANAAYAGKRALCICTISDHIYRPEDNLSAEDRQSSFTQMMEIALDTAIAMEALS
jgi:purine-nucleoside phosphorylase